MCVFVCIICMFALQRSVHRVVSALAVETSCSSCCWWSEFPRIQYFSQRSFPQSLSSGCIWSQDATTDYFWWSQKGGCFYNDTISGIFLSLLGRWIPVSTVPYYHLLDGALVVVLIIWVLFGTYMSVTFWVESISSLFSIDKLLYILVICRRLSAHIFNNLKVDCYV